jgi:hypothetical protein
VDNLPKYVQEEVRAWKDRWIEVERIQIAEWRKSTPEERYRELTQLWDFAKRLDRWPLPDPEQPRERWARLKKDFPIE